MNRTSVQRKPALKHRHRVKQKTTEQQAIIDPIVLPEAFAKQENGIKRARPIEDDRDDEIEFVGADVQSTLH